MLITLAIILTEIKITPFEPTFTCKCELCEERFKVISFHAVAVLVLLFFSFIQIDFGHAVLYYTAFFLNFPPVHFKATYSHPIEMNSELTIGSKII